MIRISGDICIHDIWRSKLEFIPDPKAHIQHLENNEQDKSIDKLDDKYDRCTGKDVVGKEPDCMLTLLTQEIKKSGSFLARFRKVRDLANQYD